MAEHSGKTLHEIFLNNGGRQINKWLHYFDIYERHFERFVGKAPTKHEIGVLGGGSLQMWRDYFGPGAKMVDLDFDEKCAAFEKYCRTSTRNYAPAAWGRYASERRNRDLC